MTQRSLELTAETGITFDAAVISEEALGWARQYNYELVTGLTDTTRKLVQQSVSTFVETPGMTRGDLESLLAPAFGENRASMIAVTEVTRAYSQATTQHQQMLKDEYGLEMRKVWQTRRDDLTCLICGPLHGMPEDDWPANLKGGPPAHVNCRCGDSLTSDDAETVRQEALAGQTAREKLLREKVAGEKVPVRPKEPMGARLEYEPTPKKLSEAWTTGQKAIEKGAGRLGIEPSELEAAIRERLDTDLQNPIAIRRGVRGATSVLQEGRFKTQFETGTSGGAFAPEYRAKGENGGLGIPMNVEPGRRPVYGYVATDTHGASGYGGIEFELRNEVKARTTITLGDSLIGFGSEYDGQQLVGTPISEPNQEGWDGSVELYHDEGVRGILYIEAQIQGGVSLEDVSRIIVHSQNPDLEFPGLLELIKKRGIEVVIDPDTL